MPGRFPRTTVEILDRTRNKVAEVRALWPLNENGTVLRYSRELSDYGFCTFRVSTKDTLFEEYGDILVPHQYHVRIKRGNTTVWQGGIIDNTVRNKNYIEVRAAEYLYYFDRILIRRDAETTPGDGKNNYRVFDSGTMAAAVQTLINNAVTDFGANHILSGVTLGTIENPDYPSNFVDGNGDQLTGAWNFSSELAVQFDYHSVLYVLKSFGIYSDSDFELTNSLVFNFKDLIGNRISGLTFQYDRIGSNIVDYNVPRYGKKMANELVGIAADVNGVILHVVKRDNASTQTYGLLQEAKAYSDVKNKNLLDGRLKKELDLLATTDESPLSLVLDEKAYPGQYGLGDVLWVRIRDNIIDFLKEKRIVGFSVEVHNTGRELTYVQTNSPSEDLMGAS